MICRKFRRGFGRCWIHNLLILWINFRSINRKSMFRNALWGMLNLDIHNEISFQMLSVFTRIFLCTFDTSITKLYVIIFQAHELIKWSLGFEKQDKKTDWIPTPSCSSVNKQRNAKCVKKNRHSKVRRYSEWYSERESERAPYSTALSLCVYAFVCVLYIQVYNMLQIYIYLIWKP